MLKEFKVFALRGNVVDMAVGIIIGGAFATIAKSLVSDIIMPPIGLLTGEVAFSDKFFVLKQGEPTGPYLTLADAQAAGAVTMNWGLFVNNVVTFIIVAIAVFFLVRAINRLKQKEDPLPEDPTTKVCEFCRTEIPIRATRCPHCTSELAA
ncbi:MAG: large conductance mechanosensitive channel protein MscL [Thermoanaerobaculia bacterium]|nr:large conductance mechanosensitive channel protein MscL [Thermoanaerobaculia bacterium]